MHTHENEHEYEVTLKHFIYVHLIGVNTRACIHAKDMICKVHSCLYVHTPTHKYTGMRTHTHTYTYMHTHI
jgi:hypothetical protein